MPKPVALVEMPDGDRHFFRDLFGLGDSNAKTAKNDTTTIYLAITPERVPGHPELGNVCAFATSCASLCLHMSGHTHGVSSHSAMIFRARLARRILYFKDRDWFMKMYHWEIKTGIMRAAKRGERLIVRLNTFSDLDWSKKHPEMIFSYPNVQFMDYTKDPGKYLRFLDDPAWPSHYHLTFSQSERNGPDCVQFLGRGGTVASVFDVKYDAQRGRKDPLPETHLGRPVIDGDVDDMRFRDPRGVIVGLRVKGKGRGKAHPPGGFVIPVLPAADLTGKTGKTSQASQTSQTSQTSQDVAVTALVA